VGQVFVFAITAAFNPTLLAAVTVMLVLDNPKRLLLGYLVGAMMTSIKQRSIANEVRQIEQGQQIFTNTVKIATTALQAYNVAKQQYDLSHQMILAPRMLYARFLFSDF